MSEDNFPIIKNYALRLLSIRPRSIREIRTRLTQFSHKHTIPPDLIEKVIEDLTSVGFLSDEEFVKWWVDQRRTFRPRGSSIIKRELQLKGIDKELIEQYVTEGRSSQDEVELARHLAEKKMARYPKMPRLELQKKIAGFLTRRGFSWEIIHRVIDSIRETSYNT